LKFLERQRAQEEWADVLPSREVEKEKLDSLVADTWEKLGPAPEVDYDQL
jgi:predicted DNA-binding protein (MmcQ/YjbR family)